MLAEYGSEAAVEKAFGGLGRDEWLRRYGENIRASAALGAHYLVFHVAQARPSEIYRRRFFYSSAQVVRATVELVNALSAWIPAQVSLLLENLWWPGLTLKDRRLAEALLEGVRHCDTGFMLDVGHLMNTNLSLRTQAEGIAYARQTVRHLGALRLRIRGVHLHCSLSGSFVAAAMRRPLDRCRESRVIMDYIARTDQHLPFSDTAVRALVDEIAPAYLVHEFLAKSAADWSRKIRVQQQALGCRLSESEEEI